MKYNINQKLIYIKDNSNTPINRRFFIMGRPYKIVRVAKSYIQITSEKDIATFRNKFILQYFKLKIKLNKRIKVI